MKAVSGSEKNPASVMQSTDSYAINLPLSLLILVFSVLLIPISNYVSGQGFLSAQHQVGVFEGTEIIQATSWLRAPSETPPHEDMGAGNRGAKAKVAMLGRFQNTKNGNQALGSPLLYEILRFDFSVFLVWTA